MAVDSAKFPLVRTGKLLVSNEKRDSNNTVLKRAERKSSRRSIAVFLRTMNLSCYLLTSLARASACLSTVLTASVVRSGG
jgi:hypothetical protein